MKTAILMLTVYVILSITSCSKTSSAHCTCSNVGGPVTRLYSPPLNHDSLETACNSQVGCVWSNN